MTQIKAKTDSSASSVGAYLDTRGITLVNMIDPVDGSTLTGLDLAQVKALVGLLQAAERKIANVNAYADDRSQYLNGTCGSMRVAGDLYEITGATPFWSRR